MYTSILNCNSYYEDCKSYNSTSYQNPQLPQNLNYKYQYSTYFNNLLPNGHMMWIIKITIKIGIVSVLLHIH